MIHKQVLPETFDFGVPSVELIGVGSKGLDKTAMVKRASAFDDILGKIEKKANRTYLHVITTGAFEKYGANQNCDAWNGDSFVLDIPCPEDGKTASVKLDGGLSKYHDDTYMKGGAVYQEHQTKRAGVEPSGEIVCARYNGMMKRGELLIAVDTVKWSSRLQKKASGKDIYLSIGADVPRDLCFPANTLILTSKGYLPIQDVKENDIVHTQQGNWKRVVATCSRQANALTRITAMGLPLPLESTPNHPIYVVRASKEAAYIAAEDIKINDELKIRIDSSSADNTVGVSFAYSYGQSRNKDKTIQDIFSWSVDEKLAVIASCIDEIGSIDKECIRISSTNRRFVLTLLRLCWSAGIPAECEDTDIGICCYCVVIRRWPAALNKYSTKIASTDCLQTADKDPVVRLHDGFAYVRVTGVSTFTTDEISVYNFEVEDDNTYNAEGVDVHNCTICGRSAKTASQHCDHFTKYRGQLFDMGKVACVMNDSPNFYDISGVDVPADRIAFVLQKVASGATQKEAYVQAINELGCRKPILLTKAASILRKLSTIEKQVQGMIEGDPSIDLDAFTDSDDAKHDFIIRIENYPSDEVIDSCNRKGLLLSPEMLFKILSNDCENESDRIILRSCTDDDCGDLSCMMQEMEEDEDQNTELLDGSFDQIMPADLNLDKILEAFLPEFGTSNPVIQSKIIRITIKGKPESKKQKKKASLNKFAQEALRRTYARYVISFAAQNDDASCMNAMMKIAAYGK